MRWEPPTMRTPGEAALRDAGRGLAPILLHVCVTDELLTGWAGLNGKAETDPPAARKAGG
jgi:hypothetical protein